MKSRIFLKLLTVFAVVIASVAFIIDLSVTSAWERSLFTQIEESLRQKTQMFAEQVSADGTRDLSAMVHKVAAASGARATIINSHGQVLADSDANPEQMENHARRPEFSNALSGREGVDTRRSHTLDIDFLYVAQPVPNGAVRLAVPLRAIAEANALVRRSILIASALACFIAVVLAAAIAANISRRLDRILHFASQIAEGDFEARLAEYQQDEIGLVARALDATARRLQSSFNELQQSRSELEAVLNSMHDAVIAVSQDGRAQWANRQMEALAPVGVRIGAPVVETVRDPNFLAAIQETFRQRRSATTRVSSFVPGRTFSVTAAPMPGGGAVAAFHDLTEVERVEKTRRDFIANVSHELRTPLTSIQGYAETLLDGVESKESEREFLEIIRRNASRMTRLTDDLLVLARVESGEKKLNLQPLSAAELLADASNYFHEHRGDSGMTLEVVNEGLKFVMADRDALFQVFSNLIDNACKYACEGKRILIGAHDVEGGVQFYVRDFGPGISSEHISRLFERFYRVDKARSRESGGTGLGLAIAKHIVRAHSGTISAESELGHGSTFIFTIPEARMQ